MSGICGTSVTTSQAIFLSTPGIGFLASTYFLRHYWCPCFKHPVQEKIAPAEQAMNNPLLYNAVRAGVDPAKYSGTFGSNMGEAIPDMRQTLLKERVYLICGLISSLLTFIPLIVIVAMGILNMPILHALPSSAFLSYAFAFYINQRNIRQFAQATFQK